MDLVSQNLLMTSGGKKDPTYIDDVFSTYLWTGDGYSGRAISNGIKLSNNNAGNGVNFDANGDYLTTSSSSDYSMGTGDYTVECWVKINSGSNNYGIFQGGGLNTSYLTGPTLFYYVGSGLSFGNGAEQGSNTHPTLNQWFHVALVKNGSNTTLYYNGTDVKTVSDTHNYTNQSFALGGYYSTSYLGPVSISNFRVVKGTAVYTSSFTVPTEPLTNVTNTKLLCCNQGSSVTAATVSAGTITVNGNPNISSGPFTENDGEGGLVWIKSRTTGHVNVLFDTVRGANERLRSDSNGVQTNTDTLQPLFTNSGFTVGGGNEVNGAGNNYASWTWRKQKGFFDIVEFTGNGTSSQVIPHNLGSVPGCIMLKAKNAADNWKVYHRGINGGVTPEKWLLGLNDTQAALEYTEWWNDTAPTATNFTVGEWNNASGWEFIAYVFAGGASTAATARSVDFDGSNDGLSATSSDLVLGTGDFTVECWWKYEGGNTDRIISMDKTSNPTNRWIVYHHQGNIRLNINGSDIFFSGFDQNDTITWHHLAIVKHNNKTKLYTDGQVKPSQYNPTNNEYADTLDYQSDQIHIGMEPNGGNNLNGKVSNVRVVAGTAVYTSAFKPPTEPLKNITNTKILCCNNSSVTGKTVGPTITATDSPTASTDSPFDDPEGFKFGEEGDQNIIKCGSFLGNGSATGPEVYLGWEPQWVLTKNSGISDEWYIFDSMRGIVTGGYDPRLRPNSNGAESSGDQRLDLTPTGFKITSNNGDINGNGNTIIYMALRRPDGYVGKPPEVGTDAFAMDLGNSNTDESWTSGFPVDFALDRFYASTSTWDAVGRLIQGKYLRTTTDAEGSYADYSFANNTGYGTGNWDTTAMAWMWKRHAGFDVVTYKGNAVAGRPIFHSLSKTPEMIWLKSRTSADQWAVGHKGLNGGTNPWHYWLKLQSTDAESNSINNWNDQAPTSTHFIIDDDNRVNKDGDNFIAMLFASVDGISKVGSYTGATAGVTVTTGFQPRFLILKNATTSSNWTVLDTTRGWGSGNDERLYLNTTAAQSAFNVGAPTSTGFTIINNWDTQGDTIIYYAHA